MFLLILRRYELPGGTYVKAFGLGVAVMILSVPAVSLAQGFYGSLHFGPNYLQSADNIDPVTGIDIESQNNTGYSVGGGLGYAFGNGLRLDGEIAYRRNSVDRLEVRSDGGLGRSLGSPVPLNGFTLDSTGSDSSLSFLVNGWYDFRNATKFTPYIGAGIGVAKISLNKVALSGFTLVDDDDVVFAYQLGGGVAYALSPRVSLTLDYRFVATTDPSFTDFEGVSFESEYRSHSILFGLRVGF